MKKLLFALLLCFITSYAVQAQTKEETITWVNQKLQTYLYLDWFGATTEDLTIKVTECFITINFTYVANERNKRPGQYYIIPTDGVEFGERKINMKNGTESIRSESGFINSASFGIKIGEENLLERLNKAVTHLATFCPKKQETF